MTPRVRLRDRIKRWLGFGPRAHSPAPRPGRGRVDHIVILDGTMSTLRPDHETNAGILYKLICEAKGDAQSSLLYEAGVQWHRWRDARDVIEGRGINRQIRRAYGFIASRYKPGDRIFLIGYSRGAYAVRSLAGLIDRVGLLTQPSATVSNIRTAYRHYQNAPDSETAKAFARIHCYDETAIEMVGVWDTVKALGMRAPIIWRWADERHRFHNHALGSSVRNGFHALALHESREAYTPVLWEVPEDWPGTIEQVWFRGSHGDIGGQLGGYLTARPLSNITLHWMLGHAEDCGIALPGDWRSRYPVDNTAPSVGMNRGWGKFFLARKKRIVGRDRSERLHPSVAAKDVPKGLHLPVLEPEESELLNPTDAARVTPAP